MTSSRKSPGEDNPHQVPPGSSPTTGQYIDDWIPVTSLEQMEKTHYDVIIVGSGAGGGAVLWRLCDKWRKSGKRIAVIERGDLALPTHAMNLPTFNFKRMMRFVDHPRFKYSVSRRTIDGGILVDFVQYVVFGGRTLHWGVGSPRFHPLDFQRFPITYRDLSPYYKVAERVMGVNRHLTEGSYIQHILLTRLRTLGYPDAEHFPLAINDRPRKDSPQRGALFSSMNLFGHALNVGSFELAVNARVTEVFTEHGRAKGVKVITADQKSYAIHGRTVVLAASTFENPRILLQSGIQNGCIGRYLVNHSCVEIEGRLALTGSLNEPGIVAIIIPRQSQRPYQVALYSERPYFGSDDGNVAQQVRRHPKILMHGFGPVEPRYENCVLLNPGQVDEYGVPNVNIQFSYGEADEAVIREMTHAMQHQAKIIGMQVSKPPCLRLPGQDFHESGTCRMGNHPDASVTNQYGEVHQVSGLFVADSSVLPYLGGANPTLTIVAVAIRTADYILHRLERHP